MASEEQTNTITNISLSATFFNLVLVFNQIK